MLADGDFLELEWYRARTNAHPHELVILTHGLEGSTSSGYMSGMTDHLAGVGYDVLAWNMRGCGRERNLLPSWYHSGQSSDLRAVVEHAIKRSPHYSISLVGISVGGNILCKYLGEEERRPSPSIKRAIAISVPLDLEGSAQTLSLPSRTLYMRHLLRPLRDRMREKAARFPGAFDLHGINTIRDFYEFDRRFTAPMHGFASVKEYWDSCSGIRFLERIAVPTHIITACDDPFLSPRCYPCEFAERSNIITLETPRHGGHVGFINSMNLSQTWLERRVAEILTTL
jgi:predicted alpha/beta-fold hydrolase